MAESEGQEQQPTQQPARTVPYDRFQAVVAKRQELEQELATLRSEAQALQERAATADTLASQIAELKASHKNAAKAWEQERAMMGAGLLDEEARVVATALHSRLPEDGRPALVDWLGQIKEDPEKAPAALRPYFGAQQQAAQADTTQRRTDTRTQPTQPSTGAQASPEAIRAAKEHGRRTGDWSRFNELRALVASESATR